MSKVETVLYAFHPPTVQGGFGSGGISFPHTAGVYGVNRTQNSVKICS